MLKENSTFILDMQKTLDIGITAFSFIAAYFIRRNLVPEQINELSTDPNYYIILLLIVIAWYISFKWMGMYMSYRQKPFWQFFTAIIKSSIMGLILLSLALYVIHIQGISRLLIGIFWVLNICLLTLVKFIVFKTLEKARKDGLNTRNILIIGSAGRAKMIIEAIETNKTCGYKIIGCIELDKNMIGKTVYKNHKIMDVIENLEVFLKEHIVDELIFAIPLKKIQGGNKYITLAEIMGIKVRIIPDWELHYLMEKPHIGTIHIEEFIGIYNMAIQTTPLNEGGLLIKNIFDYTAGFILTILFLPFFIGIAIAIKIFSKGPVFYSQERLGINGRKFKVYKFRTMVENADEMLKELQEMNEADGPVFKIKDDPRIIPHVGSFLRKTSLDELPQLFNVLRGEMSLVGPRPPIPKEVDEYSVWQRRRLSMKPGMTCFWQIAPDRNDLSFEEWMKLDLKYIDTWSLFNDFKILVLTAKAVLTGAGR